VHPRQLSIHDFSYELPDERIAQQPLAERDQSRLLLYQNGEISEGNFSELPGHLPENALLIFNDTRVVHARLLFILPTGRQVEIFCLEPVGEVQTTLAKTVGCTWRCLIGNARRWKEGHLEKVFFHDNAEGILRAIKVASAGDHFLVEFTWDPPFLTFAAVLDAAGILPLPPYLNRAANVEDESRYQTVFARHEGSVAAPTAGLHFSDHVLACLEAKGIKRGHLTLHVGAGTFRPVKAEKMQEHPMHGEAFSVSRELVQALARHRGPIVSVGTTSLRTLESLYWLGLRIFHGLETNEAEIGQWEPYDQEQPLCNRQEAFTALANWMQCNEQPVLIGRTSILIAPGYPFQVADGLVTNFHQPESTLLLLVSAFIGDNWRRVYEFALRQNFRFLSYGDSSLLWRNLT
jgi:S-adenosylmethionine:tRNA ribosyltransferase-isomerase